MSGHPHTGTANAEPEVALARTTWRIDPPPASKVRRLEVPAPSLADRTAVEVADLSLAIAAIEPSAVVVLRPASEGHELVLERGPASSKLAILPTALAEAAAVRLALLVRADFTSERVQLGLLKLRLESAECEVLVTLRAPARGTTVELRRFAQPESMASDATDRDHIGARYRIVREIGCGGMGKVYVAEHTLLAKQVAIKVLHDDLASRSGNIERFLFEARAAARARHPGVVEVTDFGRLADGRPYFVMELVEGPTLEDVLKKEGPLEPARAVAIALQIAGALEAVHASGVVHRDLKPANVLLAAGDVVKIADFGVAELVAPASGEPGTGSRAGTPLYMAPEQAIGDPTDPRSDIYSLGCLLFHMIDGEPPFWGERMEDVLCAHINGPIPSLMPMSGPLPECLRQAIRRAMAKRPQDRHQSARELAVELERAAEQLAKPSWLRWIA